MSCRKGIAREKTNYPDYKTESMNESYKRGLYRHEEEERAGEKQSNGEMGELV